MGFLRLSRKRAVGVSAVLAALVGVVLFVVVPAFAGQSLPGNAVPPASAVGITPMDVNTGGQSNDCSVFYSLSGLKSGAKQPAYQFRIANPKKGTFDYTDTVTGATFHVSVDRTDLYASFSTTSAKVVDVGIKGGTDETWYNYDDANAFFDGQPAPGFVQSDGSGGTSNSPGLHAPLQDTTTGALYSVSNLTFCYNLRSASGKVYNDANDSGTFDNGSPADSAQSGWTVRLYSGSTVVATTTSAADGSYSFNSVGLTGNYKICEVPPSGTWAQTQPSGSGLASCTGTGELPSGYAISAGTSDLTGLDFGNIQTVAGSCTNPFGVDGQYLALLANNSDGSCKQQTFAFAYSDGTTQVNGYTKLAELRPLNTSLTAVPDVEKITWTVPNNQQNQLKIYYDDVLPYSFSDAKPMLYCNLDPRQTEFKLRSPYDQLGSSGSGLVLPGTETSCLISTTESTDPSTSGKYTFVAYVYSSLDGTRYTP